MTGGLLPATEAAEILGRSPATIRTWIREGRVPGLGVRIGKMVYVRRRVLEELMGLDKEDMVKRLSGASDWDE